MSTPLLPVALTNPEIDVRAARRPIEIDRRGTRLTRIAQRVTRVTTTVERVAAGGVIGDRVRARRRR